MPPFYGTISWDKPLTSDIRHRLKALAPHVQNNSRKGADENQHVLLASQAPHGERGNYCEIPGCCVLFNGILYNAQELLPLLPEHDRACAQRCQARLVASLFQKFHHACFTRFNGDFSLALHDVSQRTFYLLNGKLQPRKIYYAWQQGYLFFAENMETIVKMSGSLPPFNSRFLPKYFAYGFVPSPHTLLEGIHRLPSGKFLQFKPTNLALETYWDIQFSEEKMEAAPTGKTSYSQEAFRVLCESTQRRFNAGARIGLFLSGGLDSGSLAAVLKHISPQTPLQTFTAVFNEQSFNEASRARTVASFFQTQHHEILFTQEKALTFVTNWIERLDDPFSDDDVICGGILSPVAEKSAEDIFLGDGPDELFMGYPSFLAHRITEIYERVPALVRKYFERAVRVLPVSYRYCAFDARFSQFLSGVGYPPALRDAAWWGPFPPASQKPLYLDAGFSLDATDVFQDVLTAQDRARAQTFVNQVLTAYIKILSERWLMKLNAVSLDTPLRFKMPYLDDDFMAFVNRIPWQYKLKPKYILRQAISPYLPQRIVQGTKRPFFVPLALWIKNGFKGLISGILTPENLQQTGLNHPTVLKMCDEHFSGHRNYARQIWNIFILTAWHRRIRRIGQGLNL